MKEMGFLGHVHMGLKRNPKKTQRFSKFFGIITLKNEQKNHTFLAVHTLKRQKFQDQAINHNFYHNCSYR